MLWIFERHGQRMRCEIRRDGGGDGFEMIVTSPDGSQRMERFDGTTDLLKRTLALQRDLLDSGWRQPQTTATRTTPSAPVAPTRAPRTAGNPES